MKVLITGATGFVGSHVTVALAANGHTVRCATRSPEQARSNNPDLEWVELDLLQPETILPALDGCDAAVFLVHSMGPGHSADYPERERAAEGDRRDDERDRGPDVATRDDCAHVCASRARIAGEGRTGSVSSARARRIASSIGIG